MKLKQSAKKTISVLLGFAFVSAGFLGLHNTMPIDSNGAMQDCVFQGNPDEPCAMTLTEHVANWHKLFTFVTPSNSLILRVLILIPFALATFTFQFSLLDKLHFQALGMRAAPPEYFSGFLLRAFGRGILRKRE